MQDSLNLWCLVVLIWCSYVPHIRRVSHNAVEEVVNNQRVNLKPMSNITAAWLQLSVLFPVLMFSVMKAGISLAHFGLFSDYHTKHRSTVSSYLNRVISLLSIYFKCPLTCMCVQHQVRHLATSVHVQPVQPPLWCLGTSQRSPTVLSRSVNFL